MRLTVNLDDETDARIDQLREANNWSKSRVVREAVEHYTKLQMDWEHLDEETLEWYIRLLHGQEHLILDTDHINLLFDGLDDVSEAYWDSLREIGQQHGIQWQGKITTLEEKLRVLEICNWYQISTIDTDTYVLTLTNPEMAEFVQTFLEAECYQMGFDITTELIGLKIMITERNNHENK